MKKNLLFAISVFAVTVSGLLVFSQSAEDNNEDRIENQSIQVEDEEAMAELRQ